MLSRWVVYLSWLEKSEPTTGSEAFLQSARRDSDKVDGIAKQKTMDGSGGRASLLTSNGPETLMKRPISSFIISYDDAVKATTFNRRGAMQASPPSILTTPASTGRLRVRPLASPCPGCCALRDAT